MTINKSQGQSLDRVGLYLPRPVFSHGQLYVAISMVKSKKGLKILIEEEDKTTNKTTNVVYKESSVDPLLAVLALVCGILSSSVVKGFVSYVHRMPFRTKRSKRIKSYVPDSSPVEDSYEVEYKDHKLSDSNTFYSSFHKTPARKCYTKDEWDEFTRESTKKALEGLVYTPDFNRWAVAHADRITLLPKKDANSGRKSWFRWS